MSAIVVGGGPAGCAAARRLRELGHDVVLLEAEDRLGGRSWTLRDDGYAIDAGALAIGTGFTRTTELIDSCRRPDEVRTFEAAIGFHDGSRCCMVRPNSLRNFLALPLVDWCTKLRLATRFVALPQDLFDERATELADEGESAMAWARRCFGDEGYEHVIRPMVQFLGTPAEDLSAAFAARLLRTNWRFRIQDLSGGIGSFAERLVDAVDVRLATAAEQVESGRGAVRVRTADGEVHEADGAVVATDAVVAGRLLASPTVSATLGRVEYLSAIHVSLGFETDPWPGLTAHWFMPVGRGEHPVVLAGLLSRKSPSGVPAGAQVVDLYFGKAASARLGDREALEQALRAAPSLLGGPAPKPSFEHVFRFPRALPILRPGAVARLGALSGAVSGRVALAGDYMAYPSIETAVRSGEAAADRVHAAARPEERQAAASAGVATA